MGDLHGRAGPSRPAGSDIEKLRFASRDFTVSSDRLTIHRFRLEHKGHGHPHSPPSVARVLVLDDSHRCLDRLLLRQDRLLYPHGSSVYCLSHAAPRGVRVEVAGPDAEEWEILAPERLQTLDTTLAGFEEWYATRHEFYDASYFNATEMGSSGYRAADLAGALQAQRDFAAAVLAEAPFRSSLEFGCATGAMVQSLRELGIDADGVDASPYAIDRAASSVRPFLTAGDFGLLDQPLEPRDAVIGQEVFEHLPPQDIPVVFRRIREVCRRWFIITVPCTPHPGFQLIDSFASLPKDAMNNPIQGHLTQASYWWWVAQAIVAGFRFEPALTNRIRRRWGINSRWWNLLVFGPARTLDPMSLEESLDSSLGPLFEPLRQDGGASFIATGRLERRGTDLVVRATRDDYPGYVHYGPYAAAERGEVLVHCRVRVTSWHPDYESDSSSPAAYLEVCADSGVKHTSTLTKRDLSSVRDGWLDLRASFRAAADKNIQVKIFHTAIADLEIACPVECIVEA
jgi:hypothetical protein